MAHQFDTGMFVRQPAWHNLGKVVADYPESTEQAREWAGLAWDPEEEAIFRDATPKHLILPDPSYVQIPGYKIIKRSDNGKVLAVMPNSYTVVDNGALFDITEALINAGKETGVKVQYETAGSLDEGRRVWSLAHLPAKELPGDPSPHIPYLFVASSHDGTTALRAGATSVRVVCANTEKAADQDMAARASVYEFRHTKNIKDQIEQAKKALSGVAYQIDNVYERARHLLSHKVTVAQREAFNRDYAIKVVIENMGGKRALAKQQKELDEILTRPAVLQRINTVAATLEELLESPTCQGISTTGYGLVQAAVEFEDWTRAANSDETRFNRQVILASGMKRFAHTLADQVLASV